MAYPFYVKDVFHTKSKQIRLGSSLSVVILKSYFALITIRFRNMIQRSKAEITCPTSIQGPPPTQLKLFFTFSKIPSRLTTLYTFLQHISHRIFCRNGGSRNGEYIKRESFKWGIFTKTRNL